LLLPLRSASPAAMALGSVSPSKPISHHAFHCISIMPPPTSFLKCLSRLKRCSVFGEVVHNVLSSGLGFLSSHWGFLWAADPYHLRVFPIKVRLPHSSFVVLEQLPAQRTDFFAFCRSLKRIVTLSRVLDCKFCIGSDHYWVWALKFLQYLHL
jgi:hypothetical protein